MVGEDDNVSEGTAVRLLHVGQRMYPLTTKNYRPPHSKSAQSVSNSSGQRIKRRQIKVDI
jgi:hypothetical protein